MQKKSASLNKVAIFNMLGPVLLNGLAFFTMPVFTRLLGAEQYGEYTKYASYLSLLSVIIGFQSAGAIAPTSVKYEGRQREECFSSIMTAGLASAVIIGVLYFLFLPQIAAFMGLPAILAATLFFHATAMFIVNFATAKFSYDKRSHITFLITLGISLMSILLSLLFIYFLPESVQKSESYIYGHTIPYLLIGAFLAVYFILKGRKPFKKEYWGFALTLCLPLIFHQLSNTLLHQCDKIMLDKQLGDASIVGVYGFAVTFANILNIIWSALNTTFVPFYHDDVRAGDKEKLYKKSKNYMFLFTGLTLGFIYAQPEVVKVFANSEFHSSINIIPLLAFGMYFVFLYSFPVNFEFYHRKTKIIAIGTCLAAVVNIVLNYFLIPVWDMVGAAVATVSSYVVLWIFHSLLSRFVIKEEYHFKYKEFYIYLAITAAFTALFYLVKDMWYIRWPFCAVLGVLLLLRIKKQKSIF